MKIFIFMLSVNWGLGGEKMKALIRWIYLALAFPGAVFGQSEQQIAAFEQQLDETIKVACHGYLPDMLPDVVSWLRDEIYEGSPLCEKANGGGEQFDRYLEEHRLSGPELDLSKRDNSDILRQIECDSDAMCVETRDRLYRDGNPISQADYNQVASHCGERYGCIADFFLEWPRSIPKPAVPVAEDSPTSFSLADLKKPTQASASPSRPVADSQNSSISNVNPRSSAAMSGLSLANLKTGTAQRAEASVEQPSNGIALGSIFAERDRLELEQAKANLLQQQNTLASLCDCSSGTQSCYDNPYGPIKNQIQNLESKRLAHCSQWSQRPAPASLDELVAVKESLLRMGDSQTMIQQIDRQAENAIAKAAADYRRLVANAKKQQEGSGFQWGKLAALGVGALAGGITELETADQIEFIGSMVADSAPGAEGISNMQNKAMTGSAASGSIGAASGLSGSLMLACNLPSQSTCIEYSLENQATYDRYRAQCQQTGAQISQSCPVSGPACTHRTSGRTSVTIAVGQDPGSIQSRCEASGGTYSMR